MADDYRLTVTLEEEGQSFSLKRLLHEQEFEAEIQEQLGNKVAVTHDGQKVFLYTAAQKQADVAKEIVRHALANHAMKAKVSPVMRWHPVEKRWEDASVPQPRSGRELQAEHERWEKEQAEEARKLGYAEWEVRVELPAHEDAVELAKQLKKEGISPIVRRWRYLLIGTANDDEARAMAERLRAEAPKGASVTAEPSWTIIWELTAKNPFAMFGAFGPAP